MQVTNRTAEFISKSPLGKVPVFEGTDGTVLFESDAITQYIAESGPAADQLIGGTPRQRAQIRKWICYAQGEILDYVTQLALWRLKYDTYNKKTEVTNNERLTKSLHCLEKVLEGRKWLVDGEKLSLADITVASGLVWGFRLLIDKEMRESLPNLVAWYERTLQVEGVKEAFGQPDYIEKRQECPKDEQEASSA